jgi:hypothetical protein
MKVRISILAAVALVAAWLYAQSSLSIAPGSTLASCPAPSAKALIFCNVAGDTANPDGAYVSANGGAYFRVSAPSSGGVTSFNGRTGVVLPASGDYKYSQLSGSPTSINCTTATISTGSTGTLNASGCTIQ